jgi:serine/threonine protein kinase
MAASRKTPVSPCSNATTSPGSANSDETEDSQDMEQTLRGTSYFTAPEVYSEMYGRKCDIWSIGGVIYQMVTANAPWKNVDCKNPVALLLHLKTTVGCPPPFDGEAVNDRYHPQFCHPEVRQIMELCFQRNPKERPSARRLLRHEFFTRSGFEDDSAVVNSTTAPIEKIEQQATCPTTPAVPNIDQPPKVIISKEDERAHTALSPQIFTDQASHDTRTKSERHLLRIDATSQVSRSTKHKSDRNLASDGSSHKECRAPVIPSIVTGGGRRLPPVVGPPPHSAPKPSNNKLGNRPNEGRLIPPLSYTSRRSNAKPVTQHDSSTVGSPVSSCRDEPMVFF